MVAAGSSAQPPHDAAHPMKLTQNLILHYLCTHVTYGGACHGRSRTNAVIAPTAALPAMTHESVPKDNCTVASFLVLDGGLSMEGSLALAEHDGMCALPIFFVDPQTEHEGQLADGCRSASGSLCMPFRVSRDSCSELTAFTCADRTEYSPICTVPAATQHKVFIIVSTRYSAFDYPGYVCVSSTTVIGWPAKLSHSWTETVLNRNP